MNRSEQSTGHELQKIRSDGVGEHKVRILSTSKTIYRMDSECSSVYGPQSNEKAERLVQELSLTARVMMTNTNLPESLWAEAMQHDRYLKNRTPSK